jgi:hypothetical protein
MEVKDDWPCLAVVANSEFRTLCAEVCRAPTIPSPYDI